MSGRCRDLVERNGYWTGRKCWRPVRFLVDNAPVCGIHKNKRLRRPGEHTVEELEPVDKRAHAARPLLAPPDPGVRNGGPLYVRPHRCAVCGKPIEHRRAGAWRHTERGET